MRVVARGHVPLQTKKGGPTPNAQEGGRGSALGTGRRSSWLRNGGHRDYIRISDLTIKNTRVSSLAVPALAVIPAREFAAPSRAWSRLAIATPEGFWRVFLQKTSIMAT
jgi:hypothetical protein